LFFNFVKELSIKDVRTH